LIAGSVIGGLAVVGVIGLVALWILKRSRRHREAAVAVDPYAGTHYDHGDGMNQPYNTPPEKYAQPAVLSELAAEPERSELK
jgi:hypothetical protein